MNADDVGVVQVAALLHFPCEIIQGGRIAGQFSRQPLNGQLITGLFIHSQPHFTATATTKLLYQLVTGGENL